MSGNVLSGNLKFLSLGDVIQFLGSNASTGVLQITNKYVQDPGLIYFKNGNPVNAGIGPSVGLDAVNSLFGWADGDFEFNEQDVTVDVVIKKSRMEIILDGLSMLDDGQIEKVGPLSFEDKTTDVNGKASTLPVIRGPLVDYMYVVDEEEAYAGTNIVKEGKHGSWFWVILEGVAEVYRETPKGPLKLLRIGEGAFIGSIASLLLLEGNVRATTIIAVDNVQLGVIDFRRLSVDFLRMSNDLRNFTISIDKRLRQVTEMAVNLYLNKVKADDYIDGKKQLIQQGGSDENLYLIQEGEASIVRHTKNGYVPLNNIHAGDFFGHVPFLDIGQEPYSASVFSSENLNSIKMDAVVLQKEFDQLSATFKHLIEYLATTVAATTIVASDIQKKSGEQKS